MIPLIASLAFGAACNIALRVITDKPTGWPGMTCGALMSLVLFCALWHIEKLLKR